MANVGKADIVRQLLKQIHDKFFVTHTGTITKAAGRKSLTVSTLDLPPSWMLIFKMAQPVHKPVEKAGV